VGLSTIRIGGIGGEKYRLVLPLPIFLTTGAVQAVAQAKKCSDLWLVLVLQLKKEFNLE